MFGMIILGAMFSIVHSSDGGVDDFATTALIAAAQNQPQATEMATFDFPAVIITNADCEPVSALSAYQKTISYLNMKTLVGMSDSRVWTQFPWTWRLDSEAMNRLPILQGFDSDDSAFHCTGDQLLVNVLKESSEVKIVATGPLTTIADVFKAYPELVHNVSEMHWMGGSIDVPGNILDSPEIPKELLNDKAEWNVFCDPAAAAWVFLNTSFPIYLYPLDISDSTIPSQFIEVLSKKEGTVYSQYVIECYKLVEHVDGYRMWDVVAAAGILFPEVLAPAVKEKLRVEVGVKDPGALVKDVQGREIFVYKAFKSGDPSQFYETVADILTGQYSAQ